MAQSGISGYSYDDLPKDIRTDEERIAEAEAELKALREQPPVLDRKEYYCKDCNNVGETFRIEEIKCPDRTLYTVRHDKCSCVKIHKEYQRITASGVSVDFNKLTFDNFVATEDWQQRMLSRIAEFVTDTEARMLFVGGQSGCGKSHLCTAAFTEIMRQGRGGTYIPWIEFVGRLKATQLDNELRNELLIPAKTNGIVYIDDLFKPIQGNASATGTDIRIAYEILNYRYIGGKKTIISSEMHIKEILALDEALGGRIAEMAGTKYMLNIKKDSARNYRLRGIGAE